MQTTDMLKLSGMLVTIDIQKAFDSVNHKFLTLALKRYGFGKMFIKRIKTLLNNQESCIINGGFTTKYFKLDKGTRQGDPISAYLFILALEIVFNLIKQNKDIHGIRHSTLCNTHENGGLKSVHIPNKLTSLQCSWIKRLYDTTTYCWKIIPAFLIRKKLGKIFFFHSNLSINPNKIKELPAYYKDILIKGGKHFLSLPFLPSSAASQCL